MKKLNTQLRCILALFLCIASTAIWADTYSHTITVKTWTANGTQTLSGVAWNLTSSGSYWGYDGTKGQQIGSSGSPATSAVISTSGISGTITSVKVTTSGASSVAANVAVSVGGTAFKTAANATTQSISATSTPYEFTGSASGAISINWAQTSSKAIYIKAIEVTYALSADVVVAPAFSLAEGYYTTPQTVTLSQTTGDKIYYTLDGTDPTTSLTAAEYTAPLLVSTTSTLKAAAKNADKYSNVVSSTYTILTPVTNLNNFRALTADGSTMYAVTLTDAIVTKVSGTNAYIEDATGGMYVYAFTGTKFVEGNRLTGTIISKLTAYNNLLEMTGSDFSQLTVASTGNVLPLTTLSVADILADKTVGRYESMRIKIADAKVTSAFSSRYATVEQSGSSVQLYDALGTSLTANVNSTLNIIGWPGLYTTTLQFKVFAQTDMEVLTSGLPAPTFAFASSTADAKIGFPFTVPELSNNSDGTVTYSSSVTGVANVDASTGAITLVASGNTVITATVAQTATYASASATYTLTVTAPIAAKMQKVVLKETFDKSATTGGNDGSWSGSVGSGTAYTDNAGWILANGSGAYKCLKFGTSSSKGSATTPALGITGDATLVFRAGAWNSASEQTDLVLSITDGTLGTTIVKMNKGAFSYYTVSFNAAAATCQITFAGKNASNSRFFLDDVVVTQESDASGDLILTGDWNATSWTNLDISSPSMTSLDLTAMTLPNGAASKIAGNPNMLILCNADVPISNGIHLVRGSNSDYVVSGDIPLTDNKPFSTPTILTAPTTYTRDFTGEAVAVGNTVKWEVISLPFVVTKVTGSVGGEVYEFVPYTAWNSTDLDANNKTKGFFYIKGATTGTNDLTADVTSIAANTPYLIAFPKITMPEYPQFNISSSTTFTFYGAEVSATVGIAGEELSDWTFHPSYLVGDGTTEYVINAEGTRFVKTGVGAAPFRPYLTYKTSSGSALPSFYTIGGDNVVTSIDQLLEKAAGQIVVFSTSAGVTVLAKNEGLALVYNLQGQLVSKTMLTVGENNITLPAGIYLVNGTKVVVK